MDTSTTAGTAERSRTLNLRSLVGSGDRIGSVVAPFILVGVAANALWPAVFEVGGPTAALMAASWVMLVPGVVIWLWSVILILTRVPGGQLITTGPYRLVKHPLYTGVAFLVLPWAGFLLDSWLGAAIGIVLYVASRRYSPREEDTLAAAFGAEWKAYCGRVLLPWL